MIQGLNELPERHVIERSTPILGGVFLSRVGIVVDYQENPGPYEAVYERVSDALTQTVIETDPLQVGRMVNAISFDAVPNANDLGESLKAKALELGKVRLNVSDRVPLSDLIQGKIGNCQIQALVAGSVFNLLEDRRQLPGSTSLERNETGTDAHPWLRRQVDRQTFIFDPNYGVATPIRSAAPEYRSLRDRLPRRLGRRAVAPAAA